MMRLEISSDTQDDIIGSVGRLRRFLKARATHAAKCDDGMAKFQVGKMKMALREVWVQDSSNVVRRAFGLYTEDYLGCSVREGTLNC
jgi:hypothetical protein